MLFSIRHLIFSHDEQEYAETASQDASAREFADNVFSQIMLRLSTDPRMFGHMSVEGAYQMNISELAHGLLNLVLVPAYEKKLPDGWHPLGANVGGVMGTNNRGSNVLVFPVLKDWGDISDVARRFEVVKPTFVHEFIHFLNLKRSKMSVKQYTKYRERLKERNQLVARHDPIALRQYWNDPQEYDAYYQDAAQHVDKMLRTGFSNAETRQKVLDEYLPANFNRFVQMMYNRFFSSDFLEYATDATDKRLRRRLYQLYEYLKNKYKK